MASVFISTPAQIVLIDSRTRSGTITLPVTNQIQYRVVSFKDQYGSFSNSTMTLSTQTGEAFDDGTTTKTFSNAFTSINLYAGSTTRWMVMNATQTTQQTISSLITNQLIFGTGAGWAQFGPIQATILSSIQQTTALSYITLLSTNQGNFSSLGVNCNTPGTQIDANGAVRMSTLLTTASAGQGRKLIFYSDAPTAPFTGTYVGAELQSAEWRNVVNASNTRFSWGWTNATNTFTEWARLSNGFLGIANTSPSFPLDVNSAINVRSTGTNVTTILSIQGGYGNNTAGNIARLSFSTTGGGGGQVATTLEQVFEGGQYGMSMKGDNITLLRVVGGAFGSSNAAMGVGVLCNAPGVALDVAGTMRSFSTVTSSITLASGAGWTTTGALQAVALSSIQLNTAVGYISSFYVGSTTTQRVGPYTAWFNGDTKVNRLLVGQASTVFGQAIGAATWDLQMIRASAAVQPASASWITYSDKRIKENIVDADLTRCYNDIKNIPLRRFQYTSSFYEAIEGYDKHILGFVAQEVSTVIPKTAVIKQTMGYSNFNLFNIDQLNMALYGAVKKTIADKEVLESTVKGQRFEITTLQGTTSLMLSTLEGLQGR